MASFKTHLAFAAVISSSACSYLYARGLLSPHETALCLSYGIAGGLLPDIDAENSKPLRLTFASLALFCASALLLMLPENTPLLHKGLWWTGAYLTIRYPLASLFGKFTTHRGAIHSLPFALFSALLLIFTLITLKNTSPHTAWLAGTFLFGGFLLHLLLDEAYSVDITGGRFKKSFGTALTLFDREAKLLYTGLYLMIAVLLMAIPEKETFRNFILTL